MAVAVPDICPVLVLKTNPAGRGGNTEKVIGVIPPKAETGLTAVSN
jgi:hypothetical protein